MTEHESEMTTNSKEFSRHIGWRTWTLAVLVLAWTLWLPFWWFRWGADLADSQKMAVVMLSILLLLIFLFGLWLPWSMQHGDPAERRIWEDPGFRSRFWVSTVVCLGCIAALAYGSWQYGPEEDDVFLASALFLFILLAYLGLLVGRTQRLYKGELEE